MNREQFYINSIAAFWNWRMFNGMTDKATAMYLAILHFADRAGFPAEVCIPNSTLLSVLDMDKRDLCRVRNVLVQMGLIEVDKGKRGQTTVYRIGDIYTTNLDTNRDTNLDTNRDTNLDTNRRKTLSSINNNIYNTNLTYNPNPSCNQGLKDKDLLPEREKPTKEKAPLKAKAEPYFLTLVECQRTVHDYTESKAVREAAMGWVRMRYAKKGDHRLSPKALDNALNKVRRLAKSEDAAVAVFAQSEERCWDGLFEVKP